MGIFDQLLGKSGSAFAEGKRCDIFHCRFYDTAVVKSAVRIKAFVFHGDEGVGEIVGQGGKRSRLFECGKVDFFSVLIVDADLRLVLAEARSVKPDARRNAEIVNKRGKNEYAEAPKIAEIMIAARFIR